MLNDQIFTETTLVVLREWMCARNFMQNRKPAPASIKVLASVGHSEFMMPVLKLVLPWIRSCYGSNIYNS